MILAEQPVWKARPSRHKQVMSKCYFADAVTGHISDAGLAEQELQELL